MPSHKSFRQKLDSDSEQRVNRELKVMVERVSDGVSQVSMFGRRAHLEHCVGFKYKRRTQKSRVGQRESPRASSRVTN